MGGSSSSPVSSHKRPKWKETHALCQKDLNLIETHLANLENMLKSFSPGKSLSIIVEAEGNLLIKVCHNCSHPDFKMILEDRLVNAVVPLILFVKQGNLQKATEIISDLRNRLKKCREELRQMNHIVRHTQFLKRWGKKHL